MVQLDPSHMDKSPNDSIKSLGAVVAAKPSSSLEVGPNEAFVPSRSMQGISSGEQDPQLLQEECAIQNVY